MSNYKTIDLERYARLFRALANPHRLQVYQLLNGCCEAGTPCSSEEVLSCCVGDLNQQLDIASSTLSHHLRELQQAGLIDMQRRGKQIFCSVNPEAQHQLRQVFNANSPLNTSLQVNYDRQISEPAKR